MPEYDKEPVPVESLTEAQAEESTQTEQESGLQKDGLPWQAYALVGSREDPDTWKLPHHTRKVYRALKGKVGIEHTVDWELVPAAVAALSRQGFESRRVQASEELILEAAVHLAGHYRKAGRPLPDALAALA